MKGAVECSVCGVPFEGYHYCNLKPAPPASKIVLWLWKNFVDGRPEYWAFDNPFPCYPNGDPMTFGSPCGFALLKDSKRGPRQDTDEQVIREIAAALEK